MKKNSKLIRELLSPPSKEKVVMLASQAIEDNTFLLQLLELYNGSDSMVTQRVAWILSHIAENSPAVLRQYEQLLMDRLQRSDVTDAIKRNTMRIWSFTGIQNDHEGKIFDICIAYLMGHEAIAIKVHAMSVALEIARPWPELKSELKLAIEDLNARESDSPGIRSKCRRTLKILSKS